VLGFHYSLNGHDEAQNKLTLRWLQSGHYAKVVLGADDLFVAERYIRDRRHNLFSQMVIDEGRTEFSSTHTPTALGFEIVDKDWPWVADVFGNFKLYKPPAPKIVLLDEPPPPSRWFGR
jgi:peptidyl-tRNA hydrolase